MTKTKSQYWRDTFESPVGELTIVVSRKGVRALLWQDEPMTRASAPTEFEASAAPPVMKQAKKQLAEYFAGKRTRFQLPLDLKGTGFQLKAWQALRKIPYGKTWSYQEQARRVGDPRKARAVGAANGRNPVSIIVPCHRVIGKNGHLTGFGAGLDAKRFLLQLENPRLANLS